MGRGRGTSASPNVSGLGKLPRYSSSYTAWLICLHRGNTVNMATLHKQTSGTVSCPPRLYDLTQWHRMCPYVSSHPVTLTCDASKCVRIRSSTNTADCRGFPTDTDRYRQTQRHTGTKEQDKHNPISQSRLATLLDEPKLSSITKQLLPHGATRKLVLDRVLCMVMCQLVSTHLLSQAAKGALT